MDAVPRGMGLNKLILAAIAALAVFIGACGPDAEVVRLQNNIRQSHGVQLTFTKSDLTSFAVQRCAQIQSNFSHAGFRVLPGYREMGENIARGYSTPASVVNAWMNSPSHRSNILYARFDSVGVAKCAGDHWVVEFGDR